MDKIDREFAMSIREQCDSLILKRADIERQISEHLKEYCGNIDPMLELILTSHRILPDQWREVVSLWAQLDMMLNVDKKSNPQPEGSGEDIQQKRET